jgi:hypothetical protein
VYFVHTVKLSVSLCVFRAPLHGGERTSQVGSELLTAPSAGQAVRPPSLFIRFETEDEMSSCNAGQPAMLFATLLLRAFSRNWCRIIP